jgi:hypothetical protein
LLELPHHPAKPFQEEPYGGACYTESQYFRNVRLNELKDKDDGGTDYDYHSKRRISFG